MSDKQGIVLLKYAYMLLLIAEMKDVGESNINDDKESLISCFLHAPTRDRACNSELCS